MGTSEASPAPCNKAIRALQRRAMVDPDGQQSSCRVGAVVRHGLETTMRVMVLVKATVDSEAGTLPSRELLEDMGHYNAQLIQAGIMKAGDGLKPTSQGKRVRFAGSDRTVVDGPFAATDELVAGFWLWEVKDMDEAVAWVKRCPNPMPGPSDIEIRPMYEASDLQ